MSPTKTEWDIFGADPVGVRLTLSCDKDFLVTVTISYSYGGLQAGSLQIV